MKAALNGKKDLVRQIGVFSASLLVISNMIGTGIFTTSGLIMEALGDPVLLLVCWLCGGLFALCGALCYGELGAKFPHAGGEYVFLRESFGRPMGFLSGWISLVVGFSAPIAAAAIAFSTYLFQALGISAGPGFPVGIFGFPVAIISVPNFTAVMVIAGFSLLHYNSLVNGSRVQNFLTVFNFLLVLAFIIAGFAFGSGSTAYFQKSSGMDQLSAEAFAVSLIFVSFAYSGWNAAAYIGGEVKKPQKNIPLALVSGTIIVMGLYLLLNAVFIYSMPADQMKGAVDIGALSARFLFGAGIGRVFSIAVAVGILSAVSAMIMTGPRIYYAMARDGVFFAKLAQVNPEGHTPGPSIFLQALVACLMVITASFDSLLIYIGFTLSIFAVFTVFGMMRIRKTRPDLVTAYRTFGYPFTPLLFIGGNLWIIIYMIKSRPVSALFGIGTIALGLMICFIFLNFRRPVALKKNTGLQTTFVSEKHALNPVDISPEKH